MLPKPLYKVELIEQDGEHRYTIDDDPTFLPGTTGILNEISKPYLLNWAAKETALYIQKILANINAIDFVRLDLDLLIKRAKKQHRFIKETAARVGSEAHSIFDWCIKEKLEMGNGKYSSSFNHWFKNNPLKIIAGETKVASQKYGYGGSLDALAEENGKLVILDFKTGKRIYDTHAYQTASYSYALKETYGLDYYPGAQVIRFEKDKAKFEIRTIRDIHDSFRAFKAALDLYNEQKLVQFSDKEIIKEKKDKVTPKEEKAK